MSKKCIYCGNNFPDKEITRDHVPSKNLFPPSNPIKNPILVPSCKKCNSDFSKDEEYFRIMLVNMTFETSKHANELFETKITKSLKNSPKLASHIFSRLHLADVYESEDKYLGKKTIMYFSTNDWRRYFNILDKYIVGIYYVTTGQSPKELNLKVEHRLIDAQKIDNKIKPYLKLNLDNKDIFEYGIAIEPEKKAGLVIICFFEKIFFMSFVAPEEFFKNEV